MVARKLLVNGNAKIDRAVLCWSIVPVASCPNCKDCASRCYARFPYNFYPNVKKAWDANFEMAKNGAFVGAVVDQLGASKKCNSVRIHVAGDFFSPDYISQWGEVADAFPKIKFYSYSKVFDIFSNEMGALTDRKNVNIVNSIAPDGGVNFGDASRVADLKKMGYTLCPVTDGKPVKCGKDCTICATNDKVCFNVHR